jgi:hypothetical protein
MQNYKKCLVMELKMPLFFENLTFIEKNVHGFIKNV